MVTKIRVDNCAVVHMIMNLATDWASPGKNPGAMSFNQVPSSEIFPTYKLAKAMSHNRSSASVPADINHFLETKKT